MKTARKIYLLTGLVCAGLLWAGVAAFGQPDSSPQVPPDFRLSDSDDLVAPTQAGDFSVAPTQFGGQAPARGTTLQDTYGSGGLIQLPLNIGGEALFKDLDAPGATLRELQQADQQLELRINRLVELYTRAIRGEEPKVTETPAQIREAIVGLVNKQFQIRQAMRKMEISSLEQRVQRLNELLQKREEAQAQIVESRLSQLLNAAEGLGWDNAAARGATSPRPAGVFRPGPMGGSRPAAPPSARYESYDLFAPATEPAAAVPAAPAPPPVPAIDR